MAKLHTEFTSDASKTEKDYQKLTREAVKLREENRKLAQQTKQGAKEQESAFAGAIGQAAATVGGMLSVQAVVGTVKGIYTEWRAEMEKLGEASKKLSQQLVHDIVATGRTADSAKIESFIGDLPAATREQGRAAYAGVAGAMPAESTDRVLEITGAVAEFAGLVPDLQGFGALVGDLVEQFPKMSAADTADMAASVRGRAGDKAEVIASDATMRAVAQLSQAGLATPAEGFGLAIEAANTAAIGDKAPALLANLAKKLGGEIELGKKASAAAQEIAAAPQSGRLEMLLGADEATRTEIVGAKDATLLRSLDLAGAARQQTDIAADVAAEMPAVLRAGLATSPGGIAALNQQQLGVDTDKSIKDKETLGRYFDAQEQELTNAANLRGDGPGTQWMERQVQNWEQWIHSFGEAQQDANAWAGTPGRSAFEDPTMATLLPPGSPEAKRIEALLEEQNALMRAAARDVSVPPTRLESSTQ